MSKEDKVGDGKPNKTSFLFKFGVVLIILSFLKWFALLYVPFLPYTGKEKISIISILLVIAEITFWIGAFLVGKETYRKYKKYFNFYWSKVKESLKKERTLLPLKNKKELLMNGKDIMNPVVAGSSMTQKPKKKSSVKRKTR